MQLSDSHLVDLDTVGSLKSVTEVRLFGGGKDIADVQHVVSNFEISWHESSDTAGHPSTCASVRAVSCRLYDSDYAKRIAARPVGLMGWPWSWFFGCDE